MDATKDAALDWTMTRIDGGRRLRIDYTFNNRSNGRLYVWDQMVVTQNSDLLTAPDAINVVNSDKPGTVRFVRGYVRSDSKINIEYNPGVRPVEAGQSVTGSAVVPLPVQSWHSYGYAQPLNSVPTAAVLEIAYFPGSQPLSDYTLQGGGKIAKPERPYTAQQVLISEAKPLPP